MPKQIQAKNAWICGIMAQPPQEITPLRGQILGYA
jgi:hypothetical protein